MTDLLKVLTRGEIATYSLRSIYIKNGYTQYKMSKFEPYDLYVQNKNFLVSDNVITFNDTDGKLMALKPDVTLSIIKNSKDKTDELMKVYYNENVYRVSKDTNSFKEIMQVGIECLGKVELDTITEVLNLAVESLETISSDSVIEISHLDIVLGVLDYLKVSDVGRAKIIKLLGEKNLQGITSILNEENVEEAKRVYIEKLVNLYGEPEAVITALQDFKVNDLVANAINELSSIVLGLKKKDKVKIDFSVVNDMSYYNGVAFKGFIYGIPTSVLSGGEYDKLMNKMGKKSKAIGFAVYLDEIERLKEEDCNFLNKR